MRQLNLLIFAAVLFFAVILVSCEKEQAVPANDTAKAVSEADSVKSPNGNYLAAKGKLTISLPDTTYTFDASVDSIAFINLDLKGKQYYGITAINKAHTLSFGISSYGTASAGTAGTVAGSQLLLSAAGKPNVEYTLTTSTLPTDIGIISLDRYSKDSIIARGTFRTFLAKGDKPVAESYKIQGTFDLKK